MRNDEFILHAGLIQDLEAAFRRNGLSREDVKELSKGKVLDPIRALVRGNAKIEIIRHIIDCSAGPDMSQLPKDWEVVEHRRTGDFVWDPNKVSLYLSESQKNGKVIKGNELRKELKDKPVLNANVLDYLLVHPELIPEEWKGKYVFFWGTIYRGSDGGLGVRCLGWGGGRWFWDGNWLGGGWPDDFPAAVSAGA